MAQQTDADENRESDSTDADSRKDVSSAESWTKPPREVFQCARYVEFDPELPLVYVWDGDTTVAVYTAHNNHRFALVHTFEVDPPGGTEIGHIGDAIANYNGPAIGCGRHIQNENGGPETAALTVTVTETVVRITTFDDYEVATWTWDELAEDPDAFGAAFTAVQKAYEVPEELLENQREHLDAQRSGDSYE